jgi:hypothetical protein
MKLSRVLLWLAGVIALVAVMLLGLKAVGGLHFGASGDPPITMGDGGNMGPMNNMDPAGHVVVTAALAFPVGTTKTAVHHFFHYGHHAQFKHGASGNSVPCPFLGGCELHLKYTDENGGVGTVDIHPWFIALGTEIVFSPDLTNWVALSALTSDVTIDTIMTKLKARVTEATYGTDQTNQCPSITPGGAREPCTVTHCFNKACN